MLAQVSSCARILTHSPAEEQWLSMFALYLSLTEHIFWVEMLRLQCQKSVIQKSRWGLRVCCWVVLVSWPHSCSGP